MNELNKVDLHYIAVLKKPINLTNNQQISKTMRSKGQIKSELITIPILLIAIILVIAGHFIMKPVFYDKAWAEYSLAALPFLMFALVIIAFKLALKNDQKAKLEEDN